jgi:CRP-like cAMP-binding protein
LANGLTSSHQDNRLLAALPREMLELMARDLRQISLAQHHPIYEPGAPIDEIYFPLSGMISLLVVAKDGGAVETATIGREGAVGLHGALGKRLSFTRATTQVAGRFSIIRASALAHLVQGHAPLRDVITRYTEVLWAEAQQLTACNAVHDTPARLCRWLLQVSDRTGIDVLPLTQELIAQMLGVRRTTVTIMAQSLQSQGAIKYMRGRISILDREKLEHCACECYVVLQQEKLPFKIGVKL